MASFRRSKYIGVSSNGSSYQVLIAINKKKTYLGSYENDKEAAVTFDFYSILLHSIEASTNYSYSAYAVKQMIDNYEQFNNSFNASYFIEYNDPERTRDN